MMDRPRAPRAPRRVRRLIAFYHAPRRYAHASWPDAVLSALADCPDPPPPLPDAPIPACLDHRRIARFVAVLDCILATCAAPADAPARRDALARTGSDADAALRADERALVHESAPLLYPPGDKAPGDESPGDESPGDESPGLVDSALGRAAGRPTGTDCLRRYYAAQTPAIAARLRLLLPYDDTPFTPVPQGAYAHAERRFLERVWNWGTRQCFW
ncbi:hypothetical protein OVY01_21635 [Robbsia sp. Bb-Pol-6]|uniref:Uncharacterized protein n=1 Tax=Robbsia betulipollinis TaxID=2981849 RepID=A0ABT3ZV83_9BURK|nr:hypothetical protein [Robbsia betulipollinis]MCY0389748.1 hypothetical protein [Robbsia betulipollinis]